MWMRELKQETDRIEYYWSVSSSNINARIKARDRSNWVLLVSIIFSSQSSFNVIVIVSSNWVLLLVSIIFNSQSSSNVKTIIRSGDRMNLLHRGHIFLLWTMPNKAWPPHFNGSNSKRALQRKGRHSQLRNCFHRFSSYSLEREKRLLSFSSIYMRGKSLFPLLFYVTQKTARDKCEWGTRYDPVWPRMDTRSRVSLPQFFHEQIRT